MEKRWIVFGDECPRCGNQAECFTDSTDDESAYDGDECRCVECDLEGSVSVGDEDDNGGCTAYVSWFDFDDEESEAGNG